MPSSRWDGRTLHSCIARYTLKINVYVEHGTRNKFVGLQEYVCCQISPQVFEGPLLYKRHRWMLNGHGRFVGATQNVLFFAPLGIYIYIFFSWVDFIGRCDVFVGPHPD